MHLYAVAVSLAVSILIVALALRRRSPAAAAPGMLRRAIGFAGGPLPLSVAIHAAILLLLILTVRQTRGRDLLMVNLEAGGGGGGGSEMQDLDMPDLPMPDVAPQRMDLPQEADTSQAVGMATEYVRAAGGGGIGIGRGGGIGSGTGKGIGPGFGGFIIDLRRKGLDVVLVIDGTESMSLIIDDVKARMGQLVETVHRLVPIARIGIVVFGGKGEQLEVQPLTVSSRRIAAFISRITTRGGGEWEEDIYGACEYAIDRMEWRPGAKKVIVMVGDAPPRKEDFQPLLGLIRRFRDRSGTFNTIDVAAEEHERFERQFWLKVHREEPPQISPLPEFYRQTEAAYQVLAAAGGGTMKSLAHDMRINREVMILAFGDNWRDQIGAFTRLLDK
jgi:hypothetical protein